MSNYLVAMMDSPNYRVLSARTAAAVAFLQSLESAVDDGVKIDAALLAEARDDAAHYRKALNTLERAFRREHEGTRV